MDIDLGYLDSFITTACGRLLIDHKNKSNPGVFSVAITEPRHRKTSTVLWLNCGKNSGAFMRLAKRLAKRGPKIDVSTICCAKRLVLGTIYCTLNVSE